jgi:hypothetical protein
VACRDARTHDKLPKYRKEADMKICSVHPLQKCETRTEDCVPVPAPPVYLENAAMDITAEDWVDYKCYVLETLVASYDIDPQHVSRIAQGLRSGGRQDRLASNPLQCPEYYYPGLTARPWHDPASFEWVAILERAYEPIRRELNSVWESGAFRQHHESELLANVGRLSEYRFYTSGSRNDANCIACPETTRLIKSIPGSVSAGSVFFSALAPGTHLRPHCGPHNARLRCHLGLITPDGCSIRVGDESRTWHEGKCLLFDDSFVHEVWNPSPSVRIVLIVDVWHPELTEMEIIALKYIDLSVFKSYHEFISEGKLPQFFKDRYYI